MIRYILSSLIAFSAVSSADVVENLSGSPVNSQGKLSYTVPLDIPASLNSLKPDLSVKYSQGSGKGTLGAGFHLSVGSSISRCAPKKNNGDIQGGITTNTSATYCLDGAQLVQHSGNEYRTYINSKNKIVSSGGIASPNHWTVYAADGFIYRYDLPVSSNVSEHNKVWQLTSKKDRFNNQITYIYNNSGDRLNTIQYPGFEISLNYKASTATQKLYSNGKVKTIGKLLDYLLVKKGNSNLYKYNFRYQSYQGYQAVATDRLMGIKKCYLVGTEECTRELTFEYKQVDGSFINENPAGSDVTNILTAADLRKHYPADSKEGMAAYHTVDLDNKYGEDICFYSDQDTLVCSMAQGNGMFAFDEDMSDAFGYNKSHFDYYSALNFSDINGDGYADLCIADDSGIKCAINNKSGKLKAPAYISTGLNHETGYQLADVNRDGLADLCGASETEFFCYANNGGGSYSSTKIVLSSSSFAKEYQVYTPYLDEDERKFKYIAPSLMDMNGDQIPDLCSVSNSQFQCRAGQYSSTNQLLIATSPAQSVSIYRVIPDEFDTKFTSVDLDVRSPNGKYFLAKEISNKFPAYRKTNERITLTTRFQDVNSDGLVDLCYDYDGEFSCHLNTETGFTEKKYKTTYSSLIAGLDRNTTLSIISSLNFSDINTDGYPDLCLMKQDRQYCSYNNGSDFSEFAVRLRIVSDAAVITSNTEVFQNYIRARLNNHTRFINNNAVNVYGRAFYRADVGTDGRNEMCMRTINGIDCHTNEQQSYNGLLEKVTDAFGNQTRFEYKNARQGIYSESSDSLDDYIRIYPQGLLLSAMQIDSGVGAPDNNWETVSYNYKDFAYNPKTYESGFKYISQSSDLKKKSQTTELYLKQHLVGKTRKVTEYLNDVKIQEVQHDFVASAFSKGVDTRLLSTTTVNYDPESPSTIIRTSTRTFSEFDGYGYAKEITEIKAAANQVKKETTSIVFDHDSENWILGKPESQTVTHELTGATNQTKKVNFEYYPSTMALHKQIFEKDTDYEKEIEFEYYSNGLVKNERITGLVNDTDKQTRTSSYTYSTIGQKLTVTNPLNQTVRSEYHAMCMAVEKEYDINDRLLVTHKYDNHCRRYESILLSGDTVYYGLSWDHGVTERPASAIYTNNIILVASESTASGKYKAVYKDRTGRTVKEISTVAKTSSTTTQSATYNYFNNKGQLVANSLPVKIVSGSSEHVNWVTHGYDDFLRQTTVTAKAPDKRDATRTTDYHGLKTTVTFNGKTKKSSVGVLGKAISKTEFGKTVHFSYTAMGELSDTVQNNDENTRITIQYDEYGFKTKQIDPSAGTWEYKYNAFGELYWQKDAEANITVNEYDVAGRLHKRTTKEGVSNWVFHDSGNGNGELDYTNAPDGVKRSYTYDAKGRVSDEYLYLNNKEKNRTHYVYDNYSRLITSEYNKNSEKSEMITPVKKNYDLAGRISQVLMPANKLKSYDYKAIENQYVSVINQIADIDRKISSIEYRIKYHAQAITKYSSKVSEYKRLTISVQPNLKPIQDLIDRHKNTLDRYSRTLEDIMEKVGRYGGLSSDKKYEYQGYNSSSQTHTFAYRECAKTVVRAFFFKRCSRYESGAFGISRDDFKVLDSNSLYGPDACQTRKSRWSLSRKILDRYDYYHVRRGVVPGGRSGPQNGLIYTVCNKTKLKFNVADIFLKMAQHYRTLVTNETNMIRHLEDTKSKVSKDKLTVLKETVKYRDSWAPVSISPLVLVPVKVPYDAREAVIMERQEALEYYQGRIAHYEALAKPHTDTKIELSAEKAITEASAKTLKDAKKALLKNIESFTSLALLKDGAEKQQQLSDSDLVVWAALNYDAQGRLKDELFGNGLITRRAVNSETTMVDTITTAKVDGTKLSELDYAYTTEGNLDEKTDNIRNLTESYTYSDNQLDTWTISLNNSQIMSRDYDYDSLGNITQKSSSLNSYVYETSGKPYRLSSFGNKTVSYDNKGFITSGNGRSYSWTSFGKPLSISYQGKITAFKYDSGNSRTVKTDSQGTTYYISSGYEQLHKPNGDIVHRYHIKNGYQTVSTIERFEYAEAVKAGEADTRQQDKVSYYARDILGSGVLITGSRGEVLKHRQYTPYGEAVDISSLNSRQTLETDSAVTEFLNSQQDAVALAEQELNVDAKLLGRVLSVTSVKDQLKGFTAHEELADVGLVHMNARLYDPVLGRFVSPDSVIPDAGKPLAYNRYAYVYNNPALASDPSGHFPWAVIGAAMYFTASHAYSDSPVHHIASTVLLAIAIGKWDALVGYSPGLIAGGTTLVTSAAVSGRIGPAEMRSAAFSAIGAELTKGIGHGGTNGGPLFGEGNWHITALAHGVAQGTLGWISNDNFWTGFVSGVASHVSGHFAGQYIGGNDVGNYFARSAVAVTTSALLSGATGGDAMQAAMTATLVHLFNYEGKGCGQMCRKRRHPKEDRLVILTVEGDIPGTAIFNLLFKPETPLPTGGEYAVGVLEYAEGGAKPYEKPNIEYDFGGGGARGLIAFDIKSPDSALTTNFVYGLGFRLHHDSSGAISGVGFAVGFSGKSGFFPSQYNKLEISHGATVLE
ncbi:MAG: FG-GAP-like repeat-containing protein [Saccharospirillaceae bacterium]|nr:FG-GAP-like repeat-containing protein [Saccharospirillaceae bacterium]